MIKIGLRKHVSSISIVTRILLLLCFFILLTADFRINNGTLWYTVFALFVYCTGASFISNINKVSSVYLLWRLIFWMWCGLSIAWAINSETALEAYIRGFTVLYIIFILTAFVAKIPEDVEELINIYFLASVLSILYIIINVDLTVIAAGARLGVRQDDIEISTNDTAMVCVNGILLVFYLIKRDWLKKSRILFYLVCLALFATILVVTGSRRAILTLLVAGLLYILIGNRSLLKSSFKIIFFSILIIIGFNMLMKNEVFATILGDRILGIAGGETSFSTHKDMIDRGWKYFFENPLFGSGHLSFMELYGKETGIYMFSHNNYTELLVNYGIIGFLLYYWFIIWVIIKLYGLTIKQKDKKAMFFLVVLLAQFVSNWSNVGHIMLSNEFMIIVAFLIIQNNNIIKKKIL